MPHEEIATIDTVAVDDVDGFRNRLNHKETLLVSRHQPFHFDLGTKSVSNHLPGMFLVTARITPKTSKNKIIFSCVFATAKKT